MTPVRPEATPADRAEAFTLVVTGLAIVPIPAVIVLDRLSPGWMPIGAAGTLIGLLIAALGLRFLRGRPVQLVAREPAPLQPPPELPLAVRLGDARNRVAAHALRASAMLAGLLLVFFDLGPARWLVLGLFVLSFLADPLLLRPTRYVLDERGLHTSSLFARGFRWDELTLVTWRRYPPGTDPPYPGGDRLIVERKDLPPLEFLFLPRHGGTMGDELVAWIRPLLGETPLHLLEPG